MTRLVARISIYQEETGAAMNYKHLYKKAHACNKCHVCIGCLYTLARKHKEKTVDKISKWLLTNIEKTNIL